jgi:hypothetical protein
MNSAFYSYLRCYLQYMLILIAMFTPIGHLLASPKKQNKAPELIVTGKRVTDTEKRIIFIDRSPTDKYGGRISYARGSISQVDNGSCFYNPLIQFVSINSFQFVRDGNTNFIFSKSGNSEVVIGFFVPSSRIFDVNTVRDTNKYDKTFVVIDHIFAKSRKISDLNFRFSQANNIFSFKSRKKSTEFRSKLHESFIICTTENDVSLDTKKVANERLTSPWISVSTVEPSVTSRVFVAAAVGASGIADKTRAEIALRDIYRKYDRIAEIENIQIAELMGSDKELWSKNFSAKRNSWDECEPVEGFNSSVVSLNCSLGVQLLIKPPSSLSPIKKFEYPKLKLPFNIGQDNFLGRDDDDLKRLKLITSPDEAFVYVQKDKQVEITNSEKDLDESEINLIRFEKKGFRPCGQNQWKRKNIREARPIIEITCTLQKK